MVALDPTIQHHTNDTILHLAGRFAFAVHGYPVDNSKFNIAKGKWQKLIKDKLVWTDLVVSIVSLHCET